MEQKQSNGKPKLDMALAVNMFERLTPPVSYQKPRPKDPEAEKLFPEFFLKDVAAKELPINWSEMRMLPIKTPVIPLMVRHMYNFKYPNIMVKIGQYVFKCQLLLLQCYSNVFNNVDGLKTTKIEFDEKEYPPKGFDIAYQWMLSKDNMEACKYINHKNILEVFYIALRMEMSELEQFCWTYIDSDYIYDEDSAFLMYMEVGGDHKLQIQEMMIPKVRRFFLTLVATKEFLELDPDSVRLFMISNYIVVSCEMEVFMSGVRWLMHDWEERKKYTIPVMSCVRFALISPMELLSLRAQEEYEAIVEIPEVNQMIMDGLDFVLAKTRVECRVVAIPGTSKSLNVLAEQTKEERAELERLKLMLPSERNWEGKHRIYKSYSEFLEVLEQNKEYYLYMKKHYVRAYPLTSGADEDKWRPPMLNNDEANDDGDVSVRTLTDTFSCKDSTIFDNYIVETPRTSVEAKYPETSVEALESDDEDNMDLNTWVRKTREEELTRLLKINRPKKIKTEKDKKEELKTNKNKNKEEIRQNINKNKEDQGENKNINSKSCEKPERNIEKKLNRCEGHEDLMDLIGFGYTAIKHDAPVLKPLCTTLHDAQSLTDQRTQNKSIQQNETLAAYVNQLLAEGKTNVNVKGKRKGQDCVESVAVKEQLKQLITSTAQHCAQDITDQSTQKKSTSQNENPLASVSKLAVNDNANMKPQSARSKLYKYVTENLPPAQKNRVNQEESWEGNMLPIKNMYLQDMRIDTFAVKALLEQQIAAAAQLDAQNITHQSTQEKSSPQNDTSVTFPSPLLATQETNVKSQSAQGKERGDYVTENLPPAQRKPVYPEESDKESIIMRRLIELDKSIEAYSEKWKEPRATSAQLYAENMADLCPKKKSLPENDDPLSFVNDLVEIEIANTPYAQSKDRGDYVTKNLPPAQQKPANPEESYEVNNVIQKLNMQDRSVEYFAAKKQQLSATSLLDAQNITDQTTQKKSHPQNDSPMALLGSLLRKVKTDVKSQSAEGKGAQRIPASLRDVYKPEDCTDKKNSVSNKNLPPVLQTSVQRISERSSVQSKTQVQLPTSRGEKNSLTRRNEVPKKSPQDATRTILNNKEQKSNPQKKLIHFQDGVVAESDIINYIKSLTQDGSSVVCPFKLSEIFKTEDTHK